jgi:hypothetical protein
MSTEKKRPRGRPPVSEAERRVRNITFRSRGDMYEKLSEAAANHARSISEEIEGRLAKSLENDKYGDPSLYHRDAQFMDFLVGTNDASKDLIRKFASELEQDRGWDTTKAKRKAFADKIAADIHRYIYPPEIFEREKQ